MPDVARQQSPQRLLSGGSPQARQLLLHVATSAEAHAVSLADRIHLFACEPAFQTLRRIGRVVLNERVREVRRNRDVLEDAADDVEHFVGFQLAPNDLELPQQRADDQTFSRVVRDEIDDDHRVVLLAEPMNAAHALFQPGRIPRDVVVHHQPAELQVDAFARRVRSEQILSPAFIGRPPKPIDLDFSLSKVHAAVNRGNLVGESHRLEPPAEPVERVPMLREDDELFVPVLRLEQELTECLKLRLLTRRQHRASKIEEAHHFTTFFIKFDERCRPDELNQSVFGGFMAFATAARGFLIGGGILEGIE